MWFVPTHPYNADADLLSLDARTRNASVDFTVTMAAVRAQPAIGTAVIIYFGTQHQGARADYDVSISHSIDGTAFGLENADTNQVTAITGAVNVNAHDYVVHVPRRKVAADFRGAVLSHLGVVVSQTVGVSQDNSGFIEQSTGGRYHYRVGYPCGR